MNMKLTLLLIISLFFIGISNAQISVGGTPVSFHYDLDKDIDLIEVPAPDMSLITVQDAQDEKNGELYKIGRPVYTDIDMENFGTWTDLPDGGKVWRLTIKCKGAEALGVTYNDFYLPTNSVLYLYNANKKHIIGGYTSYNNNDNGYFCSEILQGEEITLEYYEQPGTTEKARIKIEHLAYIYRDAHLEQYKDIKEFGTSDDCEVNANCSPEGDNWDDQKRGVVRILLLAGGGYGWCSGSLLNNTNLDCTPYVLTADHCGAPASSSELNSWTFYFLYEAPGCPNPASEGTLANKTIDGCSLIAHGGNMGDDGSDFYLVQLPDEIPDSYTPYWNGWNRENVGATSGVSIHHPAGDIKKISTFSTTLTTTGWNGSGYLSHWLVTWVATANGHGVTEGGSSGSPIFNQNKLIVGDLTGGGSYCSTPDESDMYGKFSYSWESNGTTAATQLKPWLDPTNSGVLFLEGKDYTTCGTVTVNVTGTVTNETCGGTGDGGINITASGGTPPYTYSWSTTATTEDLSGVPAGSYSVTVTESTGATGTGTWTVGTATTITITETITDASAGACDGAVNITVSGGASPYTYSWSNSATTQNITDLCAGSFSVTVTDDNGCTASESYTVVEEGLVVMADFTGVPTTIMETEFVDFTDNSFGPVTTWSWTFDGGLPGTSTDENPAGIVYNNPGSYDVTLTVSDGTNTHTTTKSGYITVAPTTAIDPVADFMAEPTTVLAGNTVDFTDLSLNVPTSWYWEFTGAGIASSTVQDPLDVLYSTPGVYPVKLKVTNAAGSDSLTKVNYIHVVIDTSTTVPVINFTAAPRLITSGETVDFTDLSTFTPVSWNWTFTGAATASSTLQHPTGIAYTTPGIYPVTLSATNASGTGSLTKTDYIVVSDYPMDEICDTITNILAGESLTFQQLSSTWGYLPGHNGKLVTAYADRHENYMISEISSFIFPVAKSYSGGGKVKFTVWNGDAEPDSILGFKQVNVSTLSSGLFNVINFDTPIEVDGIFFVGFQISYAAPDTFAVYMAPDRGTSGENTLFCQKGGSWYTATELFNVHTSSSIRPVGCLVGIDNFEVEDKTVIIFPNPSTGMFNIDLSTIDVRSLNMKVYDMTGKCLYSEFNTDGTGLYQLNLEQLNQGMYLLRMQINGSIYTRRISITR